MSHIVVNHEGLPPSLPHKVAQVIHACRRASERYGFEFTPTDYKKLRRRIIERSQNPTGIALLKHDTVHPTRLHFAVWHGAEWIPIVFDQRQKTIVTFLPKYVLRNYPDALPW